MDLSLIVSDKRYGEEITYAILSDDKFEIGSLFKKEGSVSTLNRLLQSKQLDPNIQGSDDGNGLIHCAVNENNTDIMRVLLADESTNRNIKNKAGCTPLGCAVEQGNLLATQLLLDYKANPNIISAYKNPDENLCQTVLHTAIARYGMETQKNNKQNYFGIISLLVSHKGINLEQQDSNGRTPFHYAALCDSKKIISLLLTKQENLNQAIMDKLNKTATCIQELFILYYLVHKVRLLPINPLVRPKQDKKCYTSLHLAIMEYSTALNDADKKACSKTICSLLHDGSTNLNQQDADGKTALHYAVIFGNKEFQTLLREQCRGVNQAIIDNDGKKADDYA